MTEYLDPEAARDLPGLRLVLTAGVPGPWGEAAKSIFHVKKIDYVPVRQDGGMANEALEAWTGQTNAPQAVLDDEPARSGWAAILLLAERLAPEPRLVPQDRRERALCFGLSHELCGEDGLAWKRISVHPERAGSSSRTAWGALACPVHATSASLGSPPSCRTRT